MERTVQEFVGSSYDVWWSLLAVTQVSLLVAVGLVMRRESGGATLPKLLWLLAVVLVPIVAAAIYLLITLQSRPDTAGNQR